ncbi:MAG: MerR family transcriptional regulator [Alphaproteobacteria bacterium]
MRFQKDNQNDVYDDVQQGTEAAPLTGNPVETQPSTQKAQAAQTSARSKGRKKSAGAFRTISEVADELNVQQHVLRFWETKFSQVKPLKRGGGRRYYRPEDISLLQAIYHLLYVEGYTIKGVQKLLREVGKKQIIANFSNDAPKDPTLTREAIDDATDGGMEPEVAQERVMQGLDDHQREVLRSVLTELRQLRGMIKKRD